jgi:iron complex transport system substrate-binding protein
LASRSRWAVVAAVAAAAIFAAIALRPAPPLSEQTGSRAVTDMTGRTVVVPRQIHSIATLGAVPVINGFLFAFGAGDKIVNGLPDFARTPRFKYQTVFAPSLAARPRMQAGGRQPDLERLNAAAPDVAFTMDRESAEILARGSAIPTVVLTWRQPDDVKQLMSLMGEIFDRPAAASQYISYFDETVHRVTRIVATIPDDRRPHVLYCTLRRLTQEQLISEWWIATAGGRSVTDSTRVTESYTFTLEQLFAWDPDILMLSSADDLKELHEDPRYSHLRAVQHHQVFVAPTGAHQWANRTIEQPLTLLWAAKHFFPNEFQDVDMVGEMKGFYDRIFHFTMTDGQAQEILDALL